LMNTYQRRKEAGLSDKRKPTYGYFPGMQIYHLYNIQARTMLNSKDVILDEKWCNVQDQHTIGFEEE
ncbi:hypothetical protein K7432_017419, partial [Basidiobolus ranarum]